MNNNELVEAIKRSMGMEFSNNYKLYHIFMRTMFDHEKALGKIEVFEKWMNQEKDETK